MTNAQLPAIAEDEGASQDEWAGGQPLPGDAFADVYSVLSHVQTRLRVPKDKKNSFGGWDYRNAESIYKNAKKELPEGASLYITDDLVMIGDRYYTKSAVRLRYKGEIIESWGWAREQLVQKGKDESQITGSCQSYSRKYAMQGMFLIDDGKEDVDRDSAPNYSDRFGSKTSQGIMQIANQLAVCCGADNAGSREQAKEIFKKLIPETKTEVWAMLNKQIRDWITALASAEPSKKNGFRVDY